MSKNMQRIKQTLISKELRSGRVFNACQEVLAKTGEKEVLEWGETSLANKCKCRDVC